MSKEYLCLTPEEKVMFDSIIEKLHLEVSRSGFYDYLSASHKYPVAPNLLNRQFDVEAPNKVWTTGTMRRPNAFSEV